MYVAICDDDLLIHDTVKTYINEYNCENGLSSKINTFKSGESLLEYYYADTPKPIDIVFMDIEMNELNGIETIRELQKLYQNLIIIFITSHIKHAPETFRVGAFQPLRRVLV